MKLNCSSLAHLLRAGALFALVASSAQAGTVYQFRNASLGVRPAPPAVVPQVVTLTETFDGAPVFPLTGNAPLTASWLGASSGRALGGSGNFDYYLPIMVPAQATNATLKAAITGVYPGNAPQLQKKIGGNWVMQTPYFSGPLSLAPGEYRLWGSNMTCPYAWCQNSATFIDNIVLTYSL